jgi:crotonobetainyl-CoA:carnitine CoA-transferase CaiB-like acyl-CoA transferase
VSLASPGRQTVKGSDAALAGLRVLELADEKGLYCGKLFADMGAEVVKVEAPGGDPTRWFPPFWGDRPGPKRSLFFLYNNTGKKSITLDLACGEGQQAFRELIASVDLLIETLPPGELDRLGLSWTELSKANPALVMTSISGFGQSGPHSHYKVSDLVASAMGGAMDAIGHPQDPPVKLVGSQAYVQASTLAAVSSMIALYHSARSGQGQHVDISVQEAVLAVTSICGVGKWLEDGLVAKRFGEGLFAAVPSGTYPCKDGRIYLIVNRPLHWKALAHWINQVTGNREVLDPMFDGPSSARQPYRQLLDIFISELSSQFTVEEFYRQGQQRHIAVTPLNNAHSICADHHLNERQFYVPVAHGENTLIYPGPPYRLEKTPWRLQWSAVAPGQHNSELRQLFSGQRRAVENPDAGSGVVDGAEKPHALAGLRVIEFTAGMAGPWIGRFMAYCGADVIKVESKNYPDVTRLYVSPQNPELGVQSQTSPWFTDWNAGKRFVCLDLSKPQAVDLAKALVAESDIVIDNNGNGVMEKLGLGFDQLKALKPGLILLSSTGYGKFGPDAKYISWGPNIETLSGLSSLSGFAHQECTMTQFAYPDPLSALHGLFALMCAVEHRRKTGEGQLINMAQLETVIAAMGDVLLEVFANDSEPLKLGNGSWHFAPQGCYRCKGDDHWCVMTVATQCEWQRLCALAEHPEWLQDARFKSLSARLENRAALDALIEAWTMQYDPYVLMQLLQQAGIAAGVVQNARDQFERDSHLQARHFFEEIKHHKKGCVLAPGIPLGLTATPGKTVDTGRAIGSDNQAVFCGLLGLSPEQFQAYLEAGVIEHQESAT